MLFCRKNVKNNFFEKMYLHRTKEIVTNKESVGFSTIHCQSERVCKNFRTPYSRRRVTKLPHGREKWHFICPDWYNSKDLSLIGESKFIIHILHLALSVTDVVL